MSKMKYLVLRGKKQQTRLLYLEKVSFKNEKKKKDFLREIKIEESVISRSAL